MSFTKGFMKNKYIKNLEELIKKNNLKKIPTFI
jgi:hypothetical protein